MSRIAWRRSTHRKNRLSPGMRCSQPVTGGSKAVPAITPLLPCSPRNHRAGGAERRRGEVVVVLHLEQRPDDPGRALQQTEEEPEAEAVEPQDRKSTRL